MAYASYADYCDLYRGSRLTEVEFDDYAARAGDYLELLTFARCAGELPEKTRHAVRMACCALADELQRQQTEPELRSSRVGQWSHTYAPQPSRESCLADTARLHLRGTGLLWRGWRYAQQ